MATLSLEKLTRVEIQSMSLYDQTQALADVLDQFGIIGRELISANTNLGVLRAENHRNSSREGKAQIEMAKTILENLKMRRSTLSSYKSILQTLIRSVQGTGG